MAIRPAGAPFAGARCILRICDGRRVYVTQTHAEMAEKLSRVSHRWPLIEVTDVGGHRRYFTETAITEVVPLEPQHAH